MEELELFQKYRETGDVALRNAIVEKYLYIASVIAKKFVGRGVEYDDLYQVASLALVKGVERFDPAQGVKFSTFITPTITGEIKNYFRDKSRMIHLPRKVFELRTAVHKAAEELTAQLGRTPTAREIAQKLNVTEEEVVRASEAGATVSLDNPIEDGENTTFYEVVSSDSGEEFEKLELRDVVESAVGTLTDAERMLVRLRFGQELSQTETARRMNVSQMYVSRLERKVLEKLKVRIRKGMA